jgi:hypothetical protein
MQMRTKGILAINEALNSWCEMRVGKRMGAKWLTLHQFGLISRDLLRLLLSLPGHMGT